MDDLNVYYQSWLYLILMLRTDRWRYVLPFYDGGYLDYHCCSKTNWSFLCAGELILQPWSIFYRSCPGSAYDFVIFHPNKGSGSLSFRIHVFRQTERRQ